MITGLCIRSNIKHDIYTRLTLAQIVQLHANNITLLLGRYSANNKDAMSMFLVCFLCKVKHGYSAIVIHLYMLSLYCTSVLTDPCDGWE